MTDPKQSAEAEAVTNDGEAETPRGLLGTVVVNPNCRKCGRRLVDESDLLVGRCNNDEACSRRALKGSDK